MFYLLLKIIMQRIAIPLKIFAFLSIGYYSSKSQTEIAQIESLTRMYFVDREFYYTRNLPLPNPIDYILPKFKIEEIKNF